MPNLMSLGAENPKSKPGLCYLYLGSLCGPPRCRPSALAFEGPQPPQMLVHASRVAHLAPTQAWPLLHHRLGPLLGPRQFGWPLVTETIKRVQNLVVSFPLVHSSIEQAFLTSVAEKTKTHKTQAKYSRKKLNLREALSSFYEKLNNFPPKNSKNRKKFTGYLFLCHFCYQIFPTSTNFT